MNSRKYSQSPSIWLGLTGKQLQELRQRRIDESSNSKLDCLLGAVFLVSLFLSLNFIPELFR
jgi:hypothetical protein